MTDLILLNITEKVAEIRLNRPERANALTDAMLEHLIQAVDAAANCNVLILTGNGRVFSAGADLDDVKKGLALSPNWETLSAKIANFPGLTVAALNGTVAGGAMGMVLACDVRIAANGVQFFYPALAKGVDPQKSDPARCARLIGPSRTADIFLLGRKVDAVTALQWGLVDRVVPADELDQSVLDETAGVQMAQHSAIHRIKTMIRT